MQLNPSEISDLIKQRIDQFDAGSEASNEGTVVSLQDGIARVHGLGDVMQGEMLAFPGDVYGMALNLERDSVGVVILGDYQNLSEGDTVKCTGRILEVPVGDQMLGRVVNSLGQPLDGKGPIETDHTSHRLSATASPASTPVLIRVTAASDALASLSSTMHSRLPCASSISRP